MSCFVVFYDIMHNQPVGQSRSLRRKSSLNLLSRRSMWNLRAHGTRCRLTAVAHKHNSV